MKAKGREVAVPGKQVLVTVFAKPAPLALVSKSTPALKPVVSAGKERISPGSRHLFGGKYLARSRVDLQVSVVHDTVMAVSRKMD